MLRPANPKGQSQAVQERNLHRTLGWVLMAIALPHAISIRLAPLWAFGKAFAEDFDLAVPAVLTAATPGLFLGESQSKFNPAPEILPWILGSVSLVHSVFGVSYALPVLVIKLGSVPPDLRRALTWLAPLSMLSTALALASFYYPQDVSKAQIDVVKTAFAGSSFFVNAIEGTFGKV
jgi:Na+-translocating ferredoxin:NAD+ oxidoreductase RnfD subunit